jgi:hypothetical protein
MAPLTMIAFPAALNCSGTSGKIASICRWIWPMSGETTTAVISTRSVRSHTRSVVVPGARPFSSSSRGETRTASAISGSATE